MTKYGFGKDIWTLQEYAINQTVKVSPVWKSLSYVVHSVLFISRDVTDIVVSEISSLGSPKSSIFQWLD